MEGESSKGGVGTEKVVSRARRSNQRKEFACKLVIEEFVMLPTTIIMDELFGTCEMSRSRSSV